MLILYPEYYNLFSCIADNCPDTCCAGWEVVVDEEFKSRCNSSSAPAAKKALEKIYTGSDGDLCLKLTDGRCPMLNKNNLCEIYIDMGKDALCTTCKNYPRYKKETDEFIINGISVSCPEAARLILNGTYNLYLPDFSSVNNKKYLFVFEMYNFLTEKILSGEFFGYDAMAIDDLSWNFAFKDTIPSSKSYKNAFGKKANTFNPGISLSDLYSFMKEIDALTDEWKYFTDIIKNQSDFYNENIPEELYEAINMPETKRFTIYFLYKYLWEAIDECSIALWIKRAHTMAVLYCEIFCAVKMQNKLPAGINIKETIARIVSKEIEHNGDNLELFDEFCM